MTTIPFTYLIGWSNLNTFYYGVRYKRGTTPNDLWTTYFTSSRTVSKFRLQHGEPDIIQVRRTFTSYELATKWEHRVLRRIKAVSRRDFLNKHDMKSMAAWKNEKLSDEHRKRISIAGKGRKQTKEHATKRSLAWIGRKHTNESKQKMSKSHMGMTPTPWKNPEEVKQKLRDWNAKNKPSLGIKRADSTKQKLRDLNAGAANPNYGKKWWNDGKVSKLASIPPGDGWQAGRII